MWIPLRVDSRLIVGLVVLACIGGWIAHAPLLAMAPVPWAEDAALFLPAAAQRGVLSLAEPYSGYLHLAPRLLAVAIVDAVYVEDYGAATCWSAIAAAVVVFWYLATTSLSLLRRAALSLGVALIGAPSEVVGNITNIQWLLLFVVVVGTIESEEHAHRPRAVSRTLLGLAVLSGPFSAMWLVVRSALKGKLRPSTVPEWILLVGGTTQLAVYAFARDASAPPLVVTPSSIAGFAQFALGSPYLLVLLLPILTSLVWKSQFGEALAVRVQVPLSMWLMALLIAALAWFRYVAHPDFTGFELGGDGGRYLFAQVGLAVCSLVWTAPPRATRVHAIAAIVPVVVGFLHFNSPYQRSEWSWRAAVAKAEVAGEAEITAAPYGWALPRTDGMKGWGRRLRWAYEAPLSDTSVSADCFASISAKVLGSGGAGELRGNLYRNLKGDASYLVVHNTSGTAIGYGIVTTELPSLKFPKGQTRRFRAFVKDADIPQVRRLTLLAADRSAVCASTIVD